MNKDLIAVVADPNRFYSLVEFDEKHPFAYVEFQVKNLL